VLNQDKKKTFELFVEQAAILELATNLITLHFAQLALETFKLYSATQCDSDACLIIRLWLCKMESTSNQKLVPNSNIANRPQAGLQCESNRSTKLYSLDGEPA